MNGLMENIKSLREMTGAGFLDCKKALEENNNSMPARENPFAALKTLKDEKSNS